MSNFKSFITDLTWSNSKVDVTKLKSKPLSVQFGTRTLEQIVHWSKDMYFCWWVNNDRHSSRRVWDDDIIEKNWFYLDLDLRKHIKETESRIAHDSELISILQNEILPLLNQHEVLKNFRYIVFSGNGFHLYYLWTKFVSFGEDKQYSKNDYKKTVQTMLFDAVDLLWAYGWCVDTSTCNLSRLARIPLSFNSKRESEYNLDPLACEIIEATDHYIEFEDIMKYAPKIEDEVKSDFAEHKKQKKLELIERVRKSMIYTPVSLRWAHCILDAINSIPIENVINKRLWLILASDWANFVSPWSSDYKWFFKDKKGGNYVIRGWTHYFPGKKIIYSSYDFILVKENDDHESTIQWFQANFPELKDFCQMTHEETKNDIDIFWFIGMKSNLKKKSRDIDYLSIAKYLCNKILIKLGKEKDIYQYDQNEGIWKQRSEWEITQQIEIVLSQNLSLLPDTMVTPNEVKQLLSAIYLVWSDISITEKLHLKDWFDICFSDMIYDVKNKTLRPYSPEEYKTMKLSESSDVIQELEQPTEFLQFLDEVFEWADNKDEVIETIRKFMGYCFLSSNRFSKALICYGSWCNGKSVLLDVIKEVVGQSNSTQIEMCKVWDDEQVRHNLLNKLVAIDYDLDTWFYLDQGVVKSIISWEEISAKKVYLPPVSFKPFCKIIIWTNQLPKLKSSDNSIVRRFILIPFENSFIWREDLEKKEKILSQKRLIVAWALKWLDTIIHEKRFEVPESIQNNIKAFVDENNIIGMFLDRYNLPIDGQIIWSSSWSFSMVSQSSYYQLFTKFCRELGLEGRKIPGKLDFKKSILATWNIIEHRSARWMLFRELRIK